MKASCTCLAVLALCIGAAHSQSNVSIYGRVDVGPASQTKRSTGGTLNAVNSSIWNPSQWGLKGEEDLGGGLKAFFNMGSTLLVDTGSTANATKFFDRNALVGLFSPTYGVLTIGRQVSTLAETIFVVDPLGARNGATNMNVRFGYLAAPGPTVTNNFGSTPGAVGAGLDRVDNAIKYTYRSATGLSVSAMVSAGEGTAGRSEGVLLGYGGESLNLLGSFMKYRDLAGIPFNAYATGATYRTGPFTFRASYIQNKIDSGLDTVAKPYRNMTTRVAAGGVTWTPTPLLDVNVGYYRGHRVQDGQPDQVAQKLYIAPEYRLSKRTSLIFIADFERFNEAGSALDTGTPLLPGTRSSTYVAAAISHAF